MTAGTRPTPRPGAGAPSWRECRQSHLRPSSAGAKMGAECSSEQEVGMISQLAGPASLVLSASVARRYYLDGRSKTEIADEFGLSRFKVARLIETARATGLVRIEIGHRGLIDVVLRSEEHTSELQSRQY